MCVLHTAHLKGNRQRQQATAERQQAASEGSSCQWMLSKLPGAHAHNTHLTGSVQEQKAASNEGEKLHVPDACWLSTQFNHDHY